MHDLIVIGGGAAGFFAAITAKTCCPHAKVALLEKSAVVLSKVRISGGGRCNVTHACFDPLLLSKHYPRGEKELLGPFHRFQPKDTVAWFEKRGVSLKTERDGRMFPVTDSSETIIDCLVSEARKLGVEIFLRQRLERIEKREGVFVLEPHFTASNVIVATGSSKEGYAWAENLGHTIQPPVPSLFTFNVPSSHLLELSGISFEKVKLSLREAGLSQTGPLLLTHFGFSGPAALKLSAWGARYLHANNYRVSLEIDWMPEKLAKETFEELQRLKRQFPNRTLVSQNPFSLPKNFWKTFVERKGLGKDLLLNDLPLKSLEALAETLHKDVYQVEGKTTNKEEFVTCGGVTLKEVNFKTMESKVCQGLFFAGEILDIDGITGGFNFQNAWTTGFLAGSSLSKNGFPQ